MDADDFALLSAWRDGDKAAGEALMDRHFDAVYRFVRSKVTVEPDDLAQQAFLVCVESRDRFEQRSSFRTYLFGVVRNLVLKHWRDHARHPEVALGEQSLHELAPSPLSELALRAEERLLVRALRRIPLDFQMAIELYYVEGLRSREVAEVLEVPHATVRSRLRRGLDQVRDWVERLAESPAHASTTISRLHQWAEGLRS